MRLCYGEVGASHGPYSNGVSLWVAFSWFRDGRQCSAKGRLAGIGRVAFARPGKPGSTLWGVSCVTEERLSCTSHLVMHSALRILATSRPGIEIEIVENCAFEINSSALKLQAALIQSLGIQVQQIGDIALLPLLAQQSAPRRAQLQAVVNCSSWRVFCICALGHKFAERESQNQRSQLLQHN